ncbi:MAG TPA: Ku protein [Candidatus Acidoferrum sp.]|nr:Ku protein [Candidatus Acidoferrum sp.]
MAASIWRGRITFGLVSIPVRLVKAARRERTRFRQVQRVQAPDSAIEDEIDTQEPPVQSPGVLQFPGGAKASSPPIQPEGNVAPDERVERVRNAPVSGLTEAPVQRNEILKGYEVAKDEFVVVTPEEVAALRPRTSTELEITEFVKVEEIDPVYYDTSYYVVPEAGGEKAYTLLFQTLKETGHAGMGYLAMHGRDHVALIRAGRDALVLHSMFYANEVGRAPYRVEGEANPKELPLAKMLVVALEAKFEPEKWKDHYEARLKALIESRAPVTSASTPVAERTPAPVADIMEALRKSLEKARKPVASEQQPVRPKRQPAKRT